MAATVADTAAALDVLGVRPSSTTTVLPMLALGYEVAALGTADIARARTFCFLRDIEMMKKAGLARGAEVARHRTTGLGADAEVARQTGIRSQSVRDIPRRQSTLPSRHINLPVKCRPVG